MCYLWLPRMCVSLARQLQVVGRVLNFVCFDARGIDQKIFVEVGIEYQRKCDCVRKHYNRRDHLTGSRSI